jgi:hypothetical protein
VSRLRYLPFIPEYDLISLKAISESSGSGSLIGYVGLDLFEFFSHDAPSPYGAISANRDPLEPGMWLAEISASPCLVSLS